MKKFLTRILLVFGISIIMLVTVYVVTDPFKMIKPFSFQYFDATNRDYISSELFLRNNPTYHYNSFIFGSSRCCGLNSYHWKHYLPDDARQFVFQGWGESLTGIEQKIDYLDKNGNEITNAIVLLDIPGTFSMEQLPRKALSIKHYRFSGQSRLAFQTIMFYNFLQKPSKWVSSIKQFVKQSQSVFSADTISNDWESGNKNLDISIVPRKDSLQNCSSISRNVFLKEIENKTDDDLQESKQLITDGFLCQLIHIKEVFDKHRTDYRIVISPAYCYTHPKINSKDLDILQGLFGKDRVFDYSGKNDITTDCYNFSDPNHFGLSVGWQIIEDIYNKK